MLQIVGGSYFNDVYSVNNAGDAEVYRTTDGGATWTWVANLTATTGADSDHFGNSVDISGDLVRTFSRVVPGLMC